MLRILKGISLINVNITHICDMLASMAAKPKSKKPSLRRRPQQRRAHQTVEAVLDAVIRLLKREGRAAITTNRIAEVAGVSIGSLYQYFPDKRSIFIALHQRHIEQIDRLVETQLFKHAASPLDVLMRAMIEAMVDAHIPDPELFALMAAEVPHMANGSKDFATRLHGAFRLAIQSRAYELKKGRDLDKVVFVVTNMVDALSHGAALRPAAGLSLADAEAEITQAVLAYLHA